MATLRDADESATTAISDLSLSRDVARLSEVADISEGPEDDDSGKHISNLSLGTTRNSKTVSVKN